MTFPPLPKIPQVNTPPGVAELNSRQQQYDEFQAAIEKSAAITSSQNITPQEAPTFNQETLVPDTSSFETPPPDRNGFLNRIQSLAEASAGGIMQLGAGLIPGEQSFLNEKQLAENIKAAGNELERPTNPWDMLRWDAMRHAEGWRRTDQASISLDLIPGDGINLPGDATLNDISFGVKGLAELALDPTNLIPFGATVKFGGKGTAIALRQINAGSLVEASIRGRHVMAHAADVARGALHPLGNVPQPRDLLAKARAIDISKVGGVGMDEIPGTTSVLPPGVGVRGVDAQFVRPETTDTIVKGLNDALAKMPNWVGAVRDMEGGRYSKFLVGPMQWGMTRMNPITMLHAGTDVSKRVRLATIAHQIQAVGAQTQTDFALRTLDNFGGYTGDVLHGLFSVKSTGVLAKLGVNRPIQGVFDVDDVGRITNLVNADGSLMEFADEGLNAAHHQYAVFEAAFKEGKGYSQSTMFGDKLITELSPDQIALMIEKKAVSPAFVNQSFAIKHIQDWFKEAGAMLDEFGVPRTELYDGDDMMAYIARVARGRDDILFPVNKKTTGAAQSIAKKRKYVHQNFVEGMEDGLQYENNFMLSAREFSDSVYMSIRDTQLKTKAEALGHRVRDDELNPVRSLLNAAKERVGQLDRAIALVSQNSRGAKLTGSQTKMLQGVGDDLGYDWSQTKAIDVTERQIAALKDLRLKTTQQVAEAKDLEKFVRNEAAKDLSELFTKMGIPHSRSGNIWNATEIPQAFQKAYPEFTSALRDLQAIDVKLRNATDLPKKKTRQTDRSIDPFSGKKGKPTTTTVVTSKKTVAFEKKRTTLANAIKLDAKRFAADAKAADNTVKAAQGRTLDAGENGWLKNNFPELKKELDDATSVDVGDVRKSRIAKVRKALEIELDNSKLIQEKHSDDLSKAKAGLRGDIWTVDTLTRKDHLTGKHPIKVVSGGKYRDALQDGTFLVKRREASQQRLGFLSGLFFSEDDVKALERALLLPDTSTAKGQSAGVFLRVAPAAGDLVRVLKAGFDFGAPFLQGIPVLATRPDIWAKSTRRHLKVFAMGGQVHTNYLQQNMGALREMVQMGVPFGGAASDYFTAVQRGGILPKVGQVIDDVSGMKGSTNLGARAVHKAGRTFESVATRFEQSFEAFGDYARVEMWKAMRDTAAKDGETGLKELAAFIRNSTGALNSGSLGVSPTQQALERGWLFFSPRYTRASLALVADAFQGGLRGRESRKMFAGMIAGGTATYAGIATALGQEVKLDPRSKQDGGNGAEFMTIEISGRNVGIGSFWTSFIRMVASTGAQAVEDPRTLMSPSTRDNPIARWLRSRSAPMSGMGLDLVNGTTFMGEPLDNAGAWATHIGKQSLPFVLENAIFDDGAVFGRLTTSLPAEMAGMRTFPVSVYEQRNTERDLAAAERFNKQWDELNGLQKKALENDPNRPLGRLSEKVKAESNKIRPSDPESAEGVLDAYFRSKEEIELDWRVVIKNGVGLYDDQKIDAVTLKERYIEPANADRRLRIGDLSEDESFQEVTKYFASMSDDEKAVIPEEYAFSQYIETIVSADFSDPIVGFNFRARDAAERAYGDEFGQEMLAYVRERFKAARESYDFEMPSMLDELYIGRERFQWYWRDVEAEVMKQQRNPEQVLFKYEKWLLETPTRRTEMRETNADLKGFLSTMSKTRKLLREKNPELDAFLYRWGFADTLAHQDNQFDGALDFWRHAPGMTFPLPTHTFE